MNKKNIKTIIFIVLFFIILLSSNSYFTNIYHDEEPKKDIPVIKNEETVENIKEINYEEEINNLKTEYKNDDIVGILTIENTDFKEIIVQTTDNDYYLTHSISKESDWKGQTFLDYRLDINNSKKIIIYGHNAPNQYIPFKFFENYHDNNFFKEHKYMYVQTDKEIKKFEIFSVYIEVSDWSYFSKIRFTSDEEYYNHILNLKNKSLYETGVEINSEDNILIIQTCSYHKNYSQYEKKYLLIIGKEI